MCPDPFDLSSLREYTLGTRKLLMYPHLNAAGRLFGGLLMSWIDEAGAMVAGSIMQRRSIATRKFGEVVFEAPGMLGDVVELYFRTQAKGRSSLTLECRAIVHRETDEQIPICRCTIVYVAIDPETGRSVPWREPEPGRDGEGPAGSAPARD